MTRHQRTIDERAERLLRWYPHRWRERYGEEFADLLVADIEERPQCRRRTADVAANGVVARLSVGGLGRGPVVHPQSALATVGVAVGGFLAAGVSLWSQLMVGWRWSPPDSRAVTVGIVAMSIAVVYLAVIGVLAAAPVVAALSRAVRSGESRPLVLPTALMVAGALILIVGGHHLQAAWPGNGGHPWRFQRLVPGGVAGFGWSETLGISAYWAHPADLLALPPGEFAWMLVSPVVLAATVISAGRVLRGVTLSDRALAYEARLARAAAGGMLPALGAAAWWVIESRSGSSVVFRAGSLDLLLIAGMAGAVLVAGLARRRIHYAG